MGTNLASGQGINSTHGERFGARHPWHRSGGRVHCGIQGGFNVQRNNCLLSMANDFFEFRLHASLLVFTQSSQKSWGSTD